MRTPASGASVQLRFRDLRAPRPRGRLVTGVVSPAGFTSRYRRPLKIQGAIMPSTTSIPSAAWDGSLQGRENFLRYVEISVAQHGVLHTQVFRGAEPSVTNIRLAWAIHCDIENRRSTSVTGGMIYSAHQSLTNIDVGPLDGFRPPPDLSSLTAGSRLSPWCSRGGITARESRAQVPTHTSGHLHQDLTPAPCAK